MKLILFLFPLIFTVNVSFVQNKTWKDSISAYCIESFKPQYDWKQISANKLEAVDPILFQKFFSESKSFTDYDRWKAYYYSCLEDSENGNYFKVVFLGHGHYTPYLLLVTLDSGGGFCDELVIADSFADAGDAYETSAIINKNKITVTYNDFNIGYEPKYKHIERVYHILDGGQIDLVSEIESMENFK